MHLYEQVSASKTKLRPVGSHATLRRLRTAGPKLKISRFANIGGMANLGIPVISATRYDIDERQVSCTNGKGRTLAAALVSAYGEAVERYALAEFSRSETAKFSLVDAEMGDDRFVAPSKFGYPVTRNSIDWVPGRELFSGHAVFLPAIEAHFPYFGDDRALLGVRSGSSGVAAGSSLIEAIIFAAFELFERFYKTQFLATPLEQCASHVINLDDVQLDRRTSVFKHFQNNGYEVFAYRYNVDLPMASATVIDRFNLNPKIPFGGTSCATDIESALAGAILEAVQGLCVATAGVREDLWRIEAALETNQIRQFEDNRTALAEARPVHAELAAKRRPCTAQEAIEQIKVALHRRGISELYYIELPSPVPEIAVARVLIPQVADNYVRRGAHG